MAGLGTVTISVRDCKFTLGMRSPLAVSLKSRRALGWGDRVPIPTFLFWENIFAGKKSKKSKNPKMKINSELKKYFDFKCLKIFL